MWFLSLIFGLLIGLSLGLTGGGGSIFAVPLLVYGMSVSARDAVTISLAAVGLTALVGAVGRWRQGQVEVRTGLLFAVAGMLGAPAGTWLGQQLPEALLLSLFAILMLVISVRMWRNAGERPRFQGDPDAGPTCRRDPEGVLHLTSRCAGLLSVVGLATGILSGLFGVGGGFVIVPALVIFSGMGIHRAVATSLLVIALVSASGLTSHLLSGRTVLLGVVGLFAAGGVGGMLAGNRLSRRISGPALQRTFAVAIVCVAAYILARNLA
jgi:hypothetical protein